MTASAPRLHAPQPHTLAAVLAVIAGIATFSGMDAAIKSASLAVGVYSALLGRNILGTLLTLPLWLAAGRPMPTLAVLLRVHAFRALLTSAMAALFFYGLVRLPMAEGMAISFISPILALYFAAAMLGERIRPRAIWASLLGILGVVVIASGRLGTGHADVESLKGVIAILLSATFYAANLAVQRKQALVAGPVEVALFQNLGVTLIFLVFSPFLWTMPQPGTWADILAAAALATAALMLLSWGYARAEAQVLVPIEYTAFLWAALLGWLMFDERVDSLTIAGTVLIVLGCWVGTRGKPSHDGVAPASAPDAPPLT
ncbi:DMT family transporter [Novosphingobium sp. 9]|uniref:DMT family transporter n=1 Tax=Novosphingobium sp. 9 TaxID=2025349 RepID=UPI0021B6107B|nr:DMT family transporter [Novosphingobium sp. 9]